MPHGDGDRGGDRWRFIEGSHQAVRTQAPPTALILRSAILLKNLAFTTTGCEGRNPFPRTLKKPALVTSMTATLSLFSAQSLRDCSETRFHSLSMLTVGKWSLLRCRAKVRMPFFPKYPGWYLSMAVLLWVRPPALPLPPECFLFLPTRPPPQLTEPLSFLVFLSLEVINYGVNEYYLLINSNNLHQTDFPPSLHASNLQQQQAIIFDDGRKCGGCLLSIIQMQFSDIIKQTQLSRFAPNSSFFVYCEGKKIYVKESSTHLNNFAIISPAVVPQDIAVSPNSEFIALYFKEKNIVTVFSSKGVQIAKIEDTHSGISGMLWAPDSLQLLIFTELLYKCNIYNLQFKTIASIRSPKYSSAKGCIFSSSGKLMALLERHDCRDTINIYHCGDWKLVNSFQMDSYDIVEIKWSENEAYIVAAENIINYRLYALCPYKGIVLRYQPYDFALGIKTMEFSSLSRFLAVGSFDEKIRILNVATWKLICELDCSGPASLTDQTKIYKEDDSKSEKKMKLIDRSQYKIPVTKPTQNDKAPVQGIGLLQFSCDETFLACRNDNMPYTVWIWNVKELTLQTIISLMAPVKQIKWDKYENKLCIASGTGKLLFWRNDVILECGMPAQSSFNIHRFLWSNDSKRMLLFDKNDCLYADLVND